MADLEKKILEAPKLPNHIQGDGRYLMSLLKSFLEQTATQVNLANGFSAEDLAPEEGAYITPKNFFLSFTRLGGEFTWQHIYDVSNLAYYELRTDTDVGTPAGLLERTLENNSTKMSINYSDTVYLYAVSKDGEISDPAIISYNKARPDAPTGITTTKSENGILVSFSEIPSNCVGAHIYVNNTVYTAYDNIHLITEDISHSETLQVAFFDQFGDGESGVLYFVLPDVTGLLVERNGSTLDFYWDALNIYNVKYVVKVASELDWQKGTELFKTATNDKNRIIYPNTGTYYLMVKAYDEYGNYSKNAAYQVMSHELEIDKNVIYTSNQQAEMYSGAKINVFYDPVSGGITLDREEMHGEYIFGVSLPQRYRARNWLEHTLAVLDANNDVMWDDAIFTWDDADQMWGGMMGDIDSVSVKSQISLYKGLGTTDVFAVQLYDDLLTADDEAPTRAVAADDFRGGRWNGGLFINDLTRLEYDIPKNNDGAFSLMFNLRTFEVLPLTVMIAIADDEGNSWLQLWYEPRTNEFVLRGSDANDIRVEGFLDWKLSKVERPTWADLKYEWWRSLATWGTAENFGALSDWLTVCISQSETERSLHIYSYNKEQFLTGMVEAMPVGTLNRLYCYPKLVFQN